MASPLHVAEILARYFVNHRHHGTCAAFNVTSKSIRTQTTPILWETVLCRFNNGQSARKKSIARWKSVLGSESAKYICHLVVMPSSPPDVADHRSPWDPPFLSTLTSKPNRLKLCIVAGRNKTLCAFLYHSFRPRSSDLRTILDCIAAMQVVTKSDYTTAVFRLSDGLDTLDDIPVSRQTLVALFEERDTQRYVTLDSPVTLDSIRLWLSPAVPLREGRVSLVTVELMTLLRMSVGMVGAGKELRSGAVANARLRFIAKSAGYGEAMALAQAINAAYVFDSDFGHVGYTVYTKDPLDFARTKAFLRNLERTYVNLIPAAGDVVPKTVMIVDQSRPTRGNQDRLPPDALIGCLSYDPNRLWAVRSIGMKGRELDSWVLVRKADDEASSEGEDMGAELQ